MLDKKDTETRIEDIPVVKKFPDVFFEELSGLPLDREAEFSIDLLPGTVPISKTLYRMVPVEMELNIQLQDFLEKRFI